ncbi:MAG: acetyl-CoA carboxylase carboxyl transferase subunit beta [Chloroflexota bacterium]|nr:acetyl-CoA carboxylase carboxyl transferase subunit beta [Chloroflexota bacterium]
MERIELLADPESFKASNPSLVSVDPLAFTDRVSYRDRLERARRETGLNEAVVTGTARINGRDCVLAVFDFGFMGGSMGSVVGEKIAMALELAAERHYPFISVVSSGGARMQEGMLSLVQMGKTAAAAMRLHQAGVPSVTVLTNPTTGGVYASFASQGDFLFAEPGALIGFAGPRVIEQLTGEPQPAGTHTAEFLLEHGQLDGVVDRARLRGVLATLLQLFHARGPGDARASREPYRPPNSAAPSAWPEVQLARRDDRPTAADYIRRLMPQFVELRGDRVFGDDAAVIAGIGDLAGMTVCAIGQERGHGDPKRNGGRLRPEGFRKAARIMRLAAELRLPLVTFIDTPGAHLDYDSEARGLAGALSSCLANMSVLPVPVVSVVIGEGGSGPALALGIADRILMQEHAVYSVIAPEGAAAIVHRDAARAQEIADALKMTAYDCLVLGVVDAIVPEPENGAHIDPDYAALLLRGEVVNALVELRKRDPRRLVDERWRKFRRMGEFHRLVESAEGQRAEALRTAMRRAVGSLGQLRERWPARERGQHATT